MKKTLLVLITVCFAFVAKAQIDQGTISLGGTINYSSTTSKDYNGSTTNETYKSNSFTFGPRMGYFIADGLSLGAELTFQGNSRPYNYGTNRVIVKDHAIAFSPFTRFHKSLGEKFYVFGEGMISIGSGGSKTINGSTTTKGDNLGIFGIRISPGIIFFPSEKFGMELSFRGLEFNSVTSKDSENSSNKEVDTTFRIGPNTFAPNLGVQFYF